MRSGEGKRNRLALACWGLLLLVASSWVLWPLLAKLLWGTEADSFTKSWGANVDGRVVELPGEIVFADWFVAAVIIMGLLLLVVALAWLIRQLPRAVRAGILKLDDDVATGVTTMEPSVLERALTQQLEEDPAVQTAQVSFFGSATNPALLLRVTAEPWARVPALSDSLRTQVQQAITLCLGVEPEEITVEFSVGRKQKQVAHRGVAIGMSSKAGRP